MKLQYLASVQALLDNYEFQDKYKVMLDLEETLTNMEQNGMLDQTTVLTSLGTPAQFVEEIVSKYNLSIANNGHSNINRNSESLNQSYTNHQDNNYAQPAPKANAGHSSYNQDVVSNASSYQQSKPKHNYQAANGSSDNQKQPHNDGLAVQAAKAPVKVAFTVINVIFFVVSFLIFAITIVGAMIMLVLIDVQTSLTLVLGVVFLLICVYLLIRFVKSIIYSIIENRYNVLKLSLMLIFIILFGFLANIMLSSAIDAVNLYITNNLNSVQAALTSRSIDLNNIDLQNMDLSQYIELIGEGVKAYFIPA